MINTSGKSSLIYVLRIYYHIHIYRSLFYRWFPYNIVWQRYFDCMHRKKECLLKCPLTIVHSMGLERPGAAAISSSPFDVVVVQPFRVMNFDTFHWDLLTNTNSFGYWNRCPVENDPLIFSIHRTPNHDKNDTCPTSTHVRMQNSRKVLSHD